ncbi:MAG: response regulator transcription factor [Ekhidna sp.]|nr:response regulator transcription factor [Ekhidna sp.]
MAKHNQKILVVDDEGDILEFLKYNLSKEGYNVRTATDGIKGVEVAKSFKPNLILLDIMMPKQDGVETCRQMREIPEIANSFVIFLTARSEEYSEVVAFDMGADDYITKPIKPRALISRINALFRRKSKKKKESNKITIGDLLIDRTSYTIKNGEDRISLPKKEFDLLYFLAQNPGKVFSRDELLQSVWGTDVYVLIRTVDVHVQKVREKIGKEHIITVKGVGYKFKSN